MASKLMKSIVGVLIGFIVVETIAILVIYSDYVRIQDLVQIISNNIILILAIFSILHLSSRASSYEEKTPFRKYLSSMKLFFFPIIFFCGLILINVIFEMIGLTGVLEKINTYHDSIIFYFYGREEWRVSIPLNSVVLFTAMLGAILFFIYPIETYVKQEKRAYHTISMFVCIMISPLILIDSLTQNIWVISILMTIVFIIVFLNFIYLFGVYFVVAIKSPAGPMRTGGLMIGISLLLICFVWISTWSLMVLEDWLKFLISGLIGILSLSLLNLGFFILRPINQ